MCIDEYCLYPVEVVHQSLAEIKNGHTKTNRFVEHYICLHLKSDKVLSKDSTMMIVWFGISFFVASAIETKSHIHLIPYVLRSCFRELHDLLFVTFILMLNCPYCCHLQNGKRFMVFSYRPKLYPGKPAAHSLNQFTQMQRGSSLSNDGRLFSVKRNYGRGLI